MFKYEGSISWGTMLEVDLIPAFVAVLADLNKELYNKIVQGAEYWEDLLNKSDCYLLTDKQMDDLASFMDYLFDVMQECAPEGYYFGAHPGDGSDFGYWFVEDFGV